MFNFKAPLTPPVPALDPRCCQPLVVRLKDDPSAIEVVVMGPFKGDSTTVLYIDKDGRFSHSDLEYLKRAYEPVSHQGLTVSFDIKGTI